MGLRSIRGWGEVIAALLISECMSLGRGRLSSATIEQIKNVSAYGSCQPAKSGLGLRVYWPKAYYGAKINDCQSYGPVILNPSWYRVLSVR